MGIDFKKYIGWVAKSPFNQICIGGLLLLALISLIVVPKIKFSFEMSDFFPDNSEAAQQYAFLEKEVGTLQYNYMISLAPKNGEWDYNFVNKMEEISSQLDEGLETYMPFSILDVAGTSSSSAIGLMSRNTAAQQFVNQRENWISDPRFSSFFFSKDGSSVILYLQQSGPMKLKESMSAYFLLQEIVNDYQDIDFRMMGTGYLHYVVELIQKKEIIRFAITALLVTLCFSYFLFQRNKKMVIISILSLGLMFILLGGILVLLQIPLNILMSLLPIIVLIVGTADIVHFFTKYQKELATNSNEEAIATSINDVGLATLLTSITSAFAFLALTVNSIPAIRFFGISAAIAVITAYVVLVFFTIPMLSIWMNDESSESISPKESFYLRVYHAGKKHEKTILGSTLFLLLLTAIGIYKINYDFDPLSVLPTKNEVYQDYQFFEESLEGIRPIEIFVKTENDSRVLDYDHLYRIAEVETVLVDSLSLGFCLSPTYPYKLFESFQRRDPSMFQFPQSEQRWQQVNKALMRNGSMTDFGGKQFNADSTITRIITSMPTLMSNQTAEVVEQVEKKLSEASKEGVITFKLQGFADMVDQNVDFIRKNMIISLGISLLFVSLFIALFFRKFWYAIVAFLPNALPLLFVAALIGFANVNFDSTLTMIFAILFGLVVDDSIHFLSKYKLERQRGSSVEEALQNTVEESGKAIVNTSLLIFSGLLISVTSSFYPTRLVGWLMGITILFALFCDLFLLPYLLRKFDKA